MHFCQVFFARFFLCFQHDEITASVNTLVDDLVALIGSVQQPGIMSSIITASMEVYIQELPSDSVDSFATEGALGSTR